MCNIVNAHDYISILDPSVDKYKSTLQGVSVHLLCSMPVSATIHNIHNSAQSVTSGKLEQICQNDKVYTSRGRLGWAQSHRKHRGPSKESVGTTGAHQHEHTLHYCTWSLHGNKQGSIHSEGRSKSSSVCDPATMTPLISRSLKLSVTHALDPSAGIMQQSCFVHLPQWETLLSTLSGEMLPASFAGCDSDCAAAAMKQPNCWITRLKTGSAQESTAVKR